MRSLKILQIFMVLTCCAMFLFGFTLRGHAHDSALSETLGLSIVNKSSQIKVFRNQVKGIKLLAQHQKKHQEDKEYERELWDFDIIYTSEEAIFKRHIADQIDVVVIVIRGESSSGDVIYYRKDVVIPTFDAKNCSSITIEECVEKRAEHSAVIVQSEMAPLVEMLYNEYMSDSASIANITTMDSAHLLSARGLEERGVDITEIPLPQSSETLPQAPEISCPSYLSPESEELITKIIACGGVIPVIQCFDCNEDNRLCPASYPEGNPGGTCGWPDPETGQNNIRVCAGGKSDEDIQRIIHHELVHAYDMQCFQDDNEDDDIDVIHPPIEGTDPLCSESIHMEMRAYACSGQCQFGYKSCCYNVAGSSQHFCEGYQEAYEACLRYVGQEGYPPHCPVECYDGNNNGACDAMEYNPHCADDNRNNICDEDEDCSDSRFPGDEDNDGIGDCIDTDYRNCKDKNRDGICDFAQVVVCEDRNGNGFCDEYEYTRTPVEVDPQNLRPNYDIRRPFDEPSSPNENQTESPSPFDQHLNRVR